MAWDTPAQEQGLLLTVQQDKGPNPGQPEEVFQGTDTACQAAPWSAFKDTRFQVCRRKPQKVTYPGPDLAVSLGPRAGTHRCLLGSQGLRIKFPVFCVNSSELYSKKSIQNRQYIFLGIFLQCIFHESILLIIYIQGFQGSL